MSRQSATALKAAQETVLNADTTVALKELVSLTRELVSFAEQEAHALVMGDMMRFALAQQDKEKLAQLYTKASAEFRGRASEFKGCNSALLMQLEGLQKQLKEKTLETNLLVDQIRRRTSANTRATLFTAQEMGQRAQFPQDLVKTAHDNKNGEQNV